MAAKTPEPKPKKDKDKDKEKDKGNPSTPLPTPTPVVNPQKTARFFYVDIGESSTQGSPPPKAK